MQALAAASDTGLTSLLQPLVESYHRWIEDLKRRRAAEPDLVGYDDATLEAIRQAETALGRIEDGLALLGSDEHARDAFRFANQAMAWQRVRGE